MAKDQDDPTIEAPDYSEEGVECREGLIRKLERAKKDRDQARAEFNEMKYSDRWETNMKAANSYIPPKNNPEDVRIVSGTTEAKIETFVSAMLNYNFEANVFAYDNENREIHNMGENMQAMVLKSKDMESPDYNSKRLLIYKEAATQGDCFVEDVLVECTETSKETTSDSWDDAIRLVKSWKVKEGKLKRELRTNMISGLNFFPGNINDFYIQSQPFIFTREIITEEMAEMMFKEWERYKNVPKIINKLSSYAGEDNIAFNDWSLGEIADGKKELIKYYSKEDNEFMIILNGVLMLPVGFPLEALLGINEYPITKFALFPISRHFFYSKGISERTKVDQAMIDEFLKLYTVKTQKSVKPPLANNSGTPLTSKILMPGKVTNSVDHQRIGEIGTNNGVTQSEFNFYNLLNSNLNEKSISPVFQGESPEGNQTATEIMELKKQSLQKIGLAIYGAINFEKSLSWLRLYNILQHWTKKEDVQVDKVKGGLKSIYKRIEMQDSFSDGTAGKRIIEFTDNPISGEQLMAKEDLMGMRGSKVRIAQMKPMDIRKMKANWEIIITPTPVDADALEKAQFEQALMTGLQIFGPKLNMDYFQEQWAIKNDLDPDKAFIQPEEQNMLPNPQDQASMQQGGANQQINQAIQSAQPRPQQKPSINTLANA